MANPEVKVIISAVDKASGVIKGITGGTGKLGSAFRDLTGFSLGAAGAIGITTMALKKGIDFTKQSVNETVAYNKTIREMTQVTGLNAEAISRIVQVGDDWGISIDAIRTSLAFMNKQGVTPSIDNLAKLADEYVNTTDKSAFAEKAVKILGRGYQTLIPLLALGGDGFRDAAAGIDDSLIATEEAMKASRAYEVAMDDLSDSATGLKYVLGNKLIPALTELLGSVNDNIEEFNDLSSVWDDLKKAEKLGLITTGDLIKVRVGLAAHTMDLESVSREYADVLKLLKTRELGIEESERLYRIGRGKLIPITDDLAKSEEELAKETRDATFAQEAAKRAADKVMQAYSDLDMAIDGQLGPSTEDFNDTQNDLITRMGEVQTEIDKLISEGYDPMSEEILGLKDDYGELQTQYDENATAHDDATKRILFNILEQRLALGGLTDDEEKFLERIALAWGIVDQATVDYMDKADEAGRYLNTHKGDWDNAEKILNGQTTAWLLAKQEAAFAKSKAMEYLDTINKLDGKVVTSYIRTIYTEEGNRETRRQHGGPVYSGGQYIVGEAGPEMFVPNANGMIVPNINKNTTNNTNTWNIYTNAGIGPYSRSYQMSKAMVG